VSMEKPIVELYDVDGYALVIAYPSGVLYVNQTGGYSCKHPRVEGVLILPPREIRLGELTTYFTGPPHFGWCDHGIGIMDADAIDAFIDGLYGGCELKVDRAKLGESQEAWVWVTITNPALVGFGDAPLSAVLTWPNSD
jgi:hypothetical protein